MVDDHPVGRRRKRAVLALPRPRGRAPVGCSLDLRLSRRARQPRATRARWSRACGARSHARHVPLARLGECRHRGIARSALARPRARAPRPRRRACIARPKAIRSSSFRSCRSLSRRRARIPRRATSCRCPRHCALPCARASGHVPAEARPTLDVAAVLGRRFDFETLRRRHARAGGASAPRAWRRSSSGACCARSPTTWIYDFSHDKVREVVYRDIGGARRVTLHRVGGGSSGTRGESEARRARTRSLAEHYERAHVWSKALQHLVLAGGALAHAVRACATRLHWLDRAVALVRGASGRRSTKFSSTLSTSGAARRARKPGRREGAVADIRRVIEAARRAASARRRATP